MRSLRPLAPALAAAVALALAPGTATAGPSPIDDPERVPERVTGVPRPAPPVPALPQVVTGQQRTVSDATLAERLEERSNALDPTISAQVVDLGSGGTVWERNFGAEVLPASNTKVPTAYTALRTFGRDHRFTTSVHQAKYLRDRVYLKGTGDPTLSSYRIKLLANETAKRVAAQGISTVSLRVDDTLFPEPTNAKGWEAEDVPTYVAPVRALVVDQENSMDTSLQAATVYADQLEAKGVTVRETTRAAATPTATELGSAQSPVLATIVADMLRDSQNDYAEALLWASGMEVGTARTWTGVTHHVKSTIAAAGVPTDGVTLEDGSGLSRADRIPARTMASLLVAIHRDPVQKPAFLAPTSLPVSGRTGTLTERFQTAPSSCAKDRVRAKTGSLRDTAALSGYATGSDGRVRVFSFIANDRDNTEAVRQTLDELAATTVTCM